MPRRPRRARIYKGSVEDFIRWELNPFAYLSGFERPAHSLWSDASASAFFRRHEKEIRETAEREDLMRELKQWLQDVYKPINH
ncbi:MAG TPA: hypothetical protein PK653_03635 [Syntrophales bacterium]|nr:hypothetical protein [Syntrophales bacterium]